MASHQHDVKESKRWLELTLARAEEAKCLVLAEEAIQEDEEVTYLALTAELRTTLLRRLRVPPHEVTALQARFKRWSQWYWGRVDIAGPAIAHDSVDKRLRELLQDVGRKWEVANAKASRKWEVANAKAHRRPGKANDDELLAACAALEDVDQDAWRDKDRIFRDAVETELNRLMR